MSDGKMSIDEINDFGSEVTTAGDKKFKLTFEFIDD